MAAPRILKEIVLLLALLAAGLFGLPALIYVVGQTLVGEYPGGLSAFYLAVADALARTNPFAWLLIASPLLIWQLARLWFRLGRRRSRVTQFTESAPD
jgi:hypothetical protein